MPSSTRPRPPAQPRLGEKHRFPCPVCDGGEADATYRINPFTGQPEWFVGCFTSSCRELGGAYLRAFAEQVGAPNGASIKDEPLRWIEHLIGRHLGTPWEAARAALPSEVSIERWSLTLEAHKQALRYVRTRRGLNFASIRAAEIGYVRPGEIEGPWSGFGAFTIPVRDKGELVNLRRRFWPIEPRRRTGKHVKYAGLSGCPAALYPDVPSGRPLLVVEGEFDALLARQHGFPAITSTAGTSWDPAWDTVVVGRRVAIVFDPEGYGLAQRYATRFRGAGAAEAWAVDLSKAGLGPKRDVTDWFVRYRRTAASLRRLIVSEREAGI